MVDTVDAAKLAALAAALPGRIHSAAQAMLLAERRLARVLTLRATGEPVRASEISVARMALARAQRDLEDLKRIQSVLPALPKQVQEPRRAERVADLALVQSAGPPL